MQPNTAILIFLINDLFQSCNAIVNSEFGYDIEALKKFRDTIVSKLNKGMKEKIVEICDEDEKLILTYIKIMKKAIESVIESRINQIEIEVLCMSKIEQERFLEKMEKEHGLVDQKIDFLISILNMSLNEFDDE